MDLHYIKNNLEMINGQISSACTASNRKSSEVKLLPVTKKQPLEKLQYLYDLGEKSFGENRVQELNDKAEKLPHDIEWHLIGGLQSNKVRAALKYASYIHSVDSLKLIKRIDKIALEDNKHPSIFLQVNLTQEEQKGGFSENELPEALATAATCKNLNIVGFMTMGASNSPDKENQAVFKQLKQLLNYYQTEFTQLSGLSMGMSGDFQLAILEGATYIRVGSLLLGAREY